MKKCPVCGSPRVLLRPCKYCHWQYCKKHAPPKNHNCVKYRAEHTKKFGIKLVVSAVTISVLVAILVISIFAPNILQSFFQGQTETTHPVTAEEPENASQETTQPVDTTEPDITEPEGNTETGLPEVNLPDKEELETNPKNISLKYVLRGETSHIHFTVYGGIKEYLSELPRSITYSAGEPEPTTKDFVMKFLNDEIQSDYLTELVQEIRVETGNKDDQARIAVSLIQQIPYDWGGFTSDTIEDRYPYEVIYDDMGVCGEKSRLLAFLLRELGFDVVLFNFEFENHMAAGLKCPVQYSYENTGYCFIETARPTIITDYQGEYVGVGRLTSTPVIIHISDGRSFDSVSEEYNDAQEWFRINNLANSSGGVLEQTDYNKWQSLVNKYGIEISN